MQTVQHFCLFGVAKVLYCLRMHAIFCRQYSTFATPGSKSAVLSARCGSFLQTVQHFCCPELQKCCTVCRKWHACADSTALLLPQNAKVLYCLTKSPKSHRSIRDFMGVNSLITVPILEGPPAQIPYCCIADLGDTIIQARRRGSAE